MHTRRAHPVGKAKQVSKYSSSDGDAAAAVDAAVDDDDDDDDVEGWSRFRLPLSASGDLRAPGIGIGAERMPLLLDGVAVGTGTEQQTSAAMFMALHRALLDALLLFSESPCLCLHAQNALVS